MVELDELKAILQKNPTIYTYSAKELTDTPQVVEDKYRFHIKTHISLPDLQKFADRLVTCVAHNQAAFIGGLFGEYGLGKTSTSLYLWQVCEDNGLLAVPPYDWKHFQENYEVLYRWARYRLESVSPTLVFDLDKIYGKYTSPSLEKLAETAVQEHALPYQQALAMIRGQWEQGMLKLELPEESYLDFMADVTELAKKAGYKGLVVFHDELQVTVEALSLRKVADILFRLSASMMDRVGNYGLFVGMPLGTQTALLAERRDIFDRLQRQKCFIDLGLAYTSDFPQNLWTAYADRFGFGSISEKIVRPDTLVSLGQICDANRRDLGNGPRSVVSAFNRIVEHYQATSQTYTVEQFVQDCLKGEVVLGQESKFAKNLSEVLGQPFVRGKFERLVRVMAGFPLGAPQELLEQLGVGSELQQATLRAFGELLYENANGYALVCLRPLQGSTVVALLETKIKQFFRNYAVDPQNARLAMQGFENLIVPHIFIPKDGMQGFQPVDAKGAWAIQPAYHSKLLVGTFDDALDYPQRVVRLNTSTSGVNGPVTGPEEHFTFTFNLKWQGEGGATGTVASLDNWTAALHLDLTDVLEGYSIPTLAPGTLPSKFMTPMFLLALAEHLRTQANVPKTEEPELKFVLDDIVNKVTLKLFNGSHLSVHNTDIKLNNHGQRLIPDLFRQLCKRRFPVYRTLITQAQWQKKITEYVKILESDKVSLAAARGHEAFDPAPDEEQKRPYLARLLNVSVSSIETWGQGLKDLIDMSRSREGIVTFKVHPLEQAILELIKACPDERRVKTNGKLCQAAQAGDVFHSARQLGYTDEEIQTVMGELGKARRFFQLTHKDGGRPYVYYEPVSLDELKAELHQKLTDLRKRIDNLKTVRDFSFDFQFEKSAADTEKLQSVEEYEAIRQPIHGMFERINRWIGTRFCDFSQELDKHIKAAQNDLVQLEASGLLGPLKQKLEAQATWITELTELQRQLAASTDKNRTEWQALQKASQLLANHGLSWGQEGAAKEIAQVGDERLVAHQEQVDQQKAKIAAFTARFRTLRQDISDFGQWFKLKNTSDQAWQSILVCKDSGDKGLAQEFEATSKLVLEHLKKYGREGLKNVEGFLKDLQSLQARADSFRGERRKVFLTEKERFHQLLKSIQSNVSVLRSQFVDTNPVGSYGDLFGETWDGFAGVLKELATLLAQLQNDVQYAAEYLGRGQSVDQHGLLDSTQAARSRAEDLLAKQIATEDGANAFETLAGEIEGLRSEYARLLGIYRQEVTRPEPPLPNEQQILALLGKSDKDLKEIILDLRAKEGHVDLEQVLEMISVLFRKNQLTIKVKRTG